jgi:hypothetical protein
MISVYETVNDAIIPGDSIIVGFDDIPFDATEYSSVAYWVNCAGYASLTLSVTGLTWTINVILAGKVTTGSIPLPVGMSWGDVTVTLTNTTGSTVTALNLAIGVSRDVVATGSISTVSPMTTTLSRGLVCPTSIDDEYPLSLRSSNDAALMVASMIPEDVATLDGFDPVTTINGLSYVSWGNVAPVLSNNNRLITLPSVTGSQHAIIAPAYPPAYPPMTVEYIVDVETIGDCQVKFGSLVFSITQAAVSLGLLIPQSYHLFTVTSATGAAGTLSLTINNVLVTGAVTAAANRLAQATNIATLINSSPGCLSRAVAFADRVYIRTMIAGGSGTMAVNSLYTVTSTSLISNAGFSSTSVPLSTRVLAERNDPLGLSSYRFWVRPDMVSCYRRSPNDFTSWTFVGSHSLMSTYNGGDGDLLIFNSTSYGSTSQKSVKSVSMYAKNSMKKVINTYSISRSISTWALTMMMGVIVPLTTTAIVLRYITVENLAGTPLLVSIGSGGAIPSGAMAGVNTGVMVVTSATRTGTPGGSPLRSSIVAVGVERILLNIPLAPGTLYTISVANDPLASAKGGSVGVVAVFDEVI